MASTLTPPRLAGGPVPRAAFLNDIRDLVVPGRTGRYGPLPPLLLSMTLVTGLVDAFSYLLLGHVFVRAIRR